MKRFGIFSLLFCICLSQGLAAMGNPSQQPSFVSRLAHWGSSALQQVKTGAKGALIQTGIITAISKLFTGSARPRMGAALSSSMLFVNQLIQLPFAGQYVIDEEKDNRCYCAKNPGRYYEILREQCEDPDADGPGYDWKYAGRFMAHGVVQGLLLRSVVMPAAMMLPFFPHISALMCCAYAKPGLLGLATTFGANTACQFALLMTLPLLNKYIVTPVLKRSISFGKQVWERYRGCTAGPIA